MNQKECKQLKIGTMLVSLSSGDISIVRKMYYSKNIYPNDYVIESGNNNLPLKYTGWRKASIEEIEIIYKDAIKAIC
jgi:hypothetical protein